MTTTRRVATRRSGAKPSAGKLSAIIITRNEAENLPACLESLAFCDEIVVVDTASTDDTAKIAKKAGAKLVDTRDFPGYGPQKQRALDRARGEWILSVDADERIPDALAREISAAIRMPGMAGYRIKRRTHFLGRYLRHGGWYPDRVLRLARREAAHFSPDIVHERLEVDGPVGDLENDMLHMSYRTIDDVLGKQHRYALASAQARRERGARGGIAPALGHSLFAFLKHYVLQTGFLDGSRGFVAAVSRAQESFWRYLAVGWERQDS